VVPFELRQWQDAVVDVSLDTNADADRVQLDVYRRMGGSERLATAFRLIELARRAAVTGIRSRHPDYDDEQIRLAYARLVLGDELTREVWPQHDLVAP
jgi:hypothetical protein